MNHNFWVVLKHVKNIGHNNISFPCVNFKIDIISVAFHAHDEGFTKRTLQNMKEEQTFHTLNFFHEHHVKQYLEISHKV